MANSLLVNFEFEAYMIGIQLNGDSQHRYTVASPITTAGITPTITRRLTCIRAPAPANASRSVIGAVMQSALN